jgi:hypothetical protein
VHSLRRVSLCRLFVARNSGVSLALTHVEITDPVVNTEIHRFRVKIQRSPVQVDRPLPVGSLFRAPRVVLQFLKIGHRRALLVLIVWNPGIN